MKRLALLAFCAVATVLTAQAQEMHIVRPGSLVDVFNLAEIDSVTFGVQAMSAGSPRSDGDILCVHAQSGISQFMVTGIDSVCYSGTDLMLIYESTGEVSQFNLAEVDSLSFASSAHNIVTVTYSGTTATVDNPLAGAGVAVTVAGADVIVTSTAGIDGITYALFGTTSDGMFKIYSDGDFALQLNGVRITNLNGPAINIQADEEITVDLADGTASTLTDGVTYAAPPVGEDQKAAFFSEGQLIFTGSGSVAIHGQGSAQHGLASDDYVAVQDGAIVIHAAVKDAVHTNEGYYQQGGSVEVLASDSDGVDAGDGPVSIAGGSLTVSSSDDDRDALKCSSQVLISGGTIDLTVAGDQSKGINAPDVQLTGGTVTIETSGGVVLEASGAGFDPAYCTAIKADELALVNGCDVTIVTVGQAGRGISCGGDIVIDSGSVHVTSSGGGGTYTNPSGEADAYHGPCLNADGHLVLDGGSVTLSHSGSGGKGISGDGNLTIGTAATGPTLQITTTGASIPIGPDEAAEAKAASVDSMIVVNSGDLTISTVDDALKAKYWLEINGGLVHVVNSKEGLESPNLFINGGEVHVRSTDDGINATYGIDGEFNDGSILSINGGYVHLVAPSGDAVDSNGNLTLAGGTIIVHGPPSQPEVGLDVNGTFRVTGSFTVVSQINSNMIEVPSSSQSTQRSVLVRSSQYIQAETLFHIETASGTSVLTFAPAARYSAILFTSSSLTNGTTYRIYTGGTCSGALRDGLYTGGTYAGGTLRTSFTLNQMVQTVNF